MPLTQEQITNFTTKARALGASDEQILTSIAKKQQQVAEQDRIAEAAKTGIISREAAFEAGAPLDVVRTAQPTMTAGERTANSKREAQASKANEYLSSLRNLYFAEEGSKDDLVAGRGLGGLLKRVGLKINQTTGGGAKSKVTMGGSEKELTKGQRANLYKDLSDALLAQVKLAAGEAGVLTDADIKRLKKAIPSFMTTPEEAGALFDQLSSLVNANVGNKSNDDLFREIGL